MKKVKDKDVDDSPAGILSAVSDRWDEIIRERTFNPYDEIYDFDLKRKKGESKRNFYKRQEKHIAEFIEEYLYFIERGEKHPIKLISKQMNLLADLFYAREDLKTGNQIQAAIVWANRGGGKSLIDAILIFLCMVWKNKSFSDLAGSQDQALEVYGYVSGFWDCIPILKDKLLDGEPLITKTKFKNGVNLKCIANSQNQARGKHPEGFIADETCQKERYKDENVLSATNSVLTQDEFLIVYSSTFHLPTGLFADTWENADALDFKKYKWNIYDCMEKCKRKTDCKKCQLTRRKVKRGPDGEILKVAYFGCNGRARKSKGYLSFEQVIKVKIKAEVRGLNWLVEFECRKPETAGKVYKTNKVKRALVEKIQIPYMTERVVGIDWGPSSQSAMVMGVMAKAGLLIPWSDFSSGTDLDYMVDTLKITRERFGDFVVYADAENTYAIMYLRKAGFQVEPIAFNKFKTVGIENLERYFNHKKIKILNVRPNRILHRQLIEYKKDELGKPIKKNDHGCDAILCAGLRFDFMHFFGNIVKKEVAEDALKELAKESGDSAVDIF
jgi:hypothetical protein